MEMCRCVYPDKCFCKEEARQTLWASEAEREERFLAETLPTSLGGTYYHPGGCPNCGRGPCYLLCPNHPFHYSADDEMADFERAVHEGRDHF